MNHALESWPSTSTVNDFSSSGVGRPSANAAGGGSQRGQCSYDADCGCGDPPAFSDALEHGDPFVGLYVTIQYLHAGFKESVAQHCQTGAIKRRSLCHVLLESATHNLAKFWDALSGWSPWRKLRPGISAQNGMQFPRQGSIGNCDPV